MSGGSGPSRVLHFAEVVNDLDFIDTIVRFIDPESFRSVVCAFRESNIRPPRYDPDEIPFRRLPDPGGRVDYLAMMQRIARVVDEHGIDLVHAHHFYETVVAVWGSRLSRRRPPVVFGRHYDDKLQIMLSGLKRRRYLRWDRWLCRSVALTIVPTEKIRTLIEGQQADHAPIRVIPYGFDFSAPRYRPPAPEARARTRAEVGAGDRHLLVNVGRHHPIKGQDHLLHAISRLRESRRDFVLAMVGGGPWHDHLVALARRLDLGDQVVFTGWSTRATDYLGSADVVVLPTLQEAFPQTMIEAMALGATVVTTPVSGTDGVLMDGETGVLAPPADPDSLARAIGSLMDDAGRRAQLGRAAARLVRERFPAERMAGRFEEAYRKVLGSEGGDS